MLSILSLITGGVKLVNKLLDLAERRQLIDAGMKAATNKQLQETLNVVADAKKLRDVHYLTGTERQRLRDKYRHRP